MILLKKFVTTQFVTFQLRCYFNQPMVSLLQPHEAFDSNHCFQRLGTFLKNLVLALDFQ